MQVYITQGVSLYDHINIPLQSSNTQIPHNHYYNINKQVNPPSSTLLVVTIAGDMNTHVHTAVIIVSCKWPWARYQQHG